MPECYRGFCCRVTITVRAGLWMAWLVGVHTRTPEFQLNVGSRAENRSGEKGDSRLARRDAVLETACCPLIPWVTALRLPCRPLPQNFASVADFFAASWTAPTGRSTVGRLWIVCRPVAARFLAQLLWSGQRL